MTSNLSDIKRTSEGYLQNYDDWTPEIAEDIAAELNISLTPERWFVINFLRNFYDKYHTSPSIRALVTALKIEVGEDVGNSRYLQKLFPDGPAKIATKIAGLPKPVRCI